MNLPDNDHKPLTLEDCLESLGCQQALTAEATFDFGGCVIKVKSNSEKLLEQLRSYYSDFVTHHAEADVSVAAIHQPTANISLPFVLGMRSNPEKKVKEEYCDLADGRLIRKRLTGLLFLLGQRSNTVVGDLLLNCNQVVNFINNRLINFRLHEGYLLCHSAAIARGDKAVAIAAVSGGGKSTLSLQMMNRGFDFISNDRLLIRRRNDSLVAQGIPKLPRINPGTIVHNKSLWPILEAKERDRYLEIPSDQLWNLELKFDVDLEACFGPNRFRLHAPLSAIIILLWKRIASPTTFRQVKPGELAIEPLMKAPGLFGWPAFSQQAPNSATYWSHIGEVPVYCLEGGVDFATAAEFIARLA